MTIKLRLLLFLGSVATLGFYLGKIRHRKIKINHSNIRLIFSVVMVIFSIVPGLVDFLASAFGIYSTTNFVYLLVIFLLMVKSFTNTVKLSKLSEQVTALTQALALAEKRAGDADEKGESL